MTKKELAELLDYECAMHKYGRFVLGFFPEQHAVFLFRKSQYHEQKKIIASHNEKVLLQVLSTVLRY